MKKSFDLIPQEGQQYISALPEMNFSDESVTSIRTTLDSPAFLSKPIASEIIQVNETARLLIYKPKLPKGNGSLPLLYHTHGGGLVLGNTKSYEEWNQIRADKYNAIVVAVEYRISPENRFPAAIEDVKNGLVWIHEHAEKYNIDKERISIIGESAGGGLTLALALLVRDTLQQIKIKNQILIYPMIDYTTSENPEAFPNKFAGEFVWTHQANAYGWSAYRGEQTITGDQKTYFSPSHAKDFSNLPKTFLGVGTLDLFFEENVTLIQNLSRAGNLITANIIAGGVHGFDSFPNSPIAELFNNFLDKYIIASL